MYQRPLTSQELYHHGILGMKWGVRRYQNPDGSLTAAGRRKINSMSPDKVRKKMQKEVYRIRGKNDGFSNRWMSGHPIGDNSKQVSDRLKEARKKWYSSDEHKQAEKKYDALIKLVDQEKIDMDEYDRRQHELWVETNKKAPPSNSYALGNKGREYFNNWVNTDGKDLTIAYLRDMGFNESGAKEIQKIIKRSRKKVLD